MRNLDGFTGLELLEKFKKSNNELWQVQHCWIYVSSRDDVNFLQWAFMQDRAEQGGAAYVKQQVTSDITKPCDKWTQFFYDPTVEACSLAFGNMLRA